MAGGILVSVKTNNPTLYVIGIILFLILGLVLAVLGFTGVAPGGVSTGITGVVVAIGAVVLLIEYLATKDLARPRPS